VTDGGLELRAGVALAALDFDLFSQQLPLPTIEISQDGFPLSFQPEAAAPLLVGAYSEVRDELRCSHDIRPCSKLS
jgi:hypothetical protein